jgi:RNA-directed DNA polymerase
MNAQLEMKICESSLESRLKQAEETRDRWKWVEPNVWTDRMLNALENGVKGGMWFSLIDKVYKPSNLEAALKKVIANKGSAGVDHVTIEKFQENKEEELAKLSAELQKGKYKPQAVKRVYIPKPGTKETRPLGIPTVRGRVAEAAVVQVIEPIFEKEFAPNSYGFRPGRSQKDALREVDRLLREGNLYVVDADIKKYFDTIPHAQLMKQVEERVADGRLLELIEMFLKQEANDQGTVTRSCTGTPQGGVISPLLANVYLNPLDHQMIKSGKQMIRFADDLVILCGSLEEAEQAMTELRQWVENAGLTLHPEKTRIVNMNEIGTSFEFLGYRFEVNSHGKIRRWPRQKSLNKFKDRVRVITRRSNGHSLMVIIKRINEATVGWFEYFKHSFLGIFPDLDGWIRGRLRSILRRRRGRKGRGRGSDHQRWPNHFFHNLGLFSMSQACGEIVQST